jgi:hypothetical protein
VNGPNWIVTATAWKVEAHTGGGGRYAIRRIPAGAWRVTVAYDGYQTVRSDVEISQDTEMNFELRPNP